MPYTAEHKQRSRARIIKCARHLFNRFGYIDVSIDVVMAEAGLTRGAFYNHFKSKEDLFLETLVDYAEHREFTMSNSAQSGPELARRIFAAYVSRQHLDKLEDQCPLMALPSDISRAGPAVRAAYQRVLEALAGVFAINVKTDLELSSREHGLAVAAMCVGAMVLARTIDDVELAEEICDSARAFMSAATPWADQ